MIATVVEQFLVFVIWLIHFFSKKNMVAFVKVTSFIKRSKAIMSIGLSSFVRSVGNQIVHYLGNNELAVYGVAGNIFTLIQTFSYGIGNAAQPIVAEILGAGKMERVDETKWLGSIVAAGIGIVVVVFSLLLPMQIVSLYMKASNEVLAIAPSILRQYFLCLLFVPFNVFATYYLQAVKKVKASVTVSVLWGFILGGIFVYVFSIAVGAGSIWFVVFSVECIKALITIYTDEQENFPSNADSRASLSNDIRTISSLVSISF